MFSWSTSLLSIVISMTMIQQRTQETMNLGVHDGFQRMRPCRFGVCNLRLDNYWWRNFWGWNDFNSFSAISCVDDCCWVWSSFHCWWVWPGLHFRWIRENLDDGSQRSSFNDRSWVRSVEDWDWWWRRWVVDFSCCRQGFCAWNVVLFSWGTILDVGNWWS